MIKSSRRDCHCYIVSQMPLSIKAKTWILRRQQTCNLWGQSRTKSSKQQVHIPRLNEDWSIWGYKSLRGWVAWEVREVAEATWGVVSTTDKCYLFATNPPQKISAAFAIADSIFLNSSISWFFVHNRWQACGIV